MGKLRKSDFVFRRHETIGAEGAEEDSTFLFDCFIDNGDLAVLRDTRSPHRLVIGRTGAGKTALLLKLKNHEDNVAWLEPDRLALQYLANSTILRRLEELGVDLDIFYRLLWRHILCVELIKLKYKLRDEREQQRFLERIRERFLGDKNKKVALDYMIEWGEGFWEDTEYRVHEVTQKLERDVQASLGAKSGFLDAHGSEAAKFSEQDRREIVHRVQEVVNGVQIRRLQEVINILASDIFDDPQERFFVIIDRLDEKWVDDALRYRLIRALIETIRSLKSITSAKVIISIRLDLLRCVFRETRDTGFQEEKYQPLMLDVQWTKSQLLELMNLRIRKLIRRQYTNRSVEWSDVFPSEIGRVKTSDYLFDRTMLRPRDVIQFANCCIQQATDRPEITVRMVRAAEGDYSHLRLRSLADEWAADFPELLQYARILHGRTASFEPGEIESDDIYSVMEQVLEHPPRETGVLTKWAIQVCENKLDEQELRSKLLYTFYLVGLVGIRPRNGDAISWSHVRGGRLHDHDFGHVSRVHVNPMFHRALGTTESH